MQAILITIGDELLIGQTIDTNSAWMGQQLNQIGIWVKEKIAISDDAAHILKTLDYAISQADLVLITGGLGPTKDDITKHTLCKYFDAQLILNQEVLTHVENIFKRRGMPMVELLEVNKQQAMVPDCCTVLFNASGTAPGMMFQKNNTILISMPGVPFEMQHIMQTHVLPMMEKISDEQVLHRTLITAGVGESFLADKIKDWENDLPPFLKLAYLPSIGMVKLRLTARGKKTDSLQMPLDKAFEALKILVSEYLFAENDEPMEKTIGKMLLKKNAKLCVAESCTGGFIASKMVSMAGSSQYFEGGIVSYSYQAKENLLGVKKQTLEKFGAVSEQCVTEMCTNVLEKFKTDFSIAVSGIAGPDGGTNDKPVGTVWIAIGSKQKTTAKKFHFTKDRSRNIELTFVHALKMLMSELNSTK